MGRAQRFGAAVLAFGFLVGVSAQAEAQQRGTGSGYTTATPIMAESMDLPDGRTIERNAYAGYVIANEPDNPFNLVNQNCNLTNVVSADGTIEGGTYCDGIDRDGDVFWLSGHGDQDGGTWTFIGGTGKFAGIEGGGTYATAAMWPGGQIVFSWSGSWTMK